MHKEAAALGWLKKWLAARVPGGRFGRSLVWLSGGTALGQAITLAVSPLLTRLYRPEDFGVFGVYVSLLGIITVVASLRYEYALPLPEDERTAFHVLALCFLALGGTTLVGGLAVWWIGEELGEWSNLSELGKYVWLLPVGILAAGTYQILSYWGIRERCFPMLAQTRINRGLLRAGVQVGLGAVYPGPSGLVVGQLIGEMAGSGSLGREIWKRYRHLWGSLRWREVFQAGRRYRRFLFFSSGADFLDSLGLHGPLIFFAAFYGPEVAGWFTLGQRVIAAPLNIVVDAAGQVYFGEVAQLAKNDPKAMKGLFLRVAGRLALIGAIPVGGMCLLAPWVFEFLFGSDWEVAGQYVQILGAMFAVRFPIAPLSHTLNVLERQDLHLLWEGTRLVLVLGGLTLTRVLGGSDLMAVGAYSVTMTIGYLVLGTLCWYALSAVRKEPIDGRSVENDKVERGSV
ncbi:MAG: lipopolysaccharide biosynthesis protein [Thermoguttaceae bacterium]|nr:lipopolysaccharide biosynthesis protein [Thermoguttaceae bacterium]MDW8038415.1 lipopolysaccharide biosynthesis protein [Thermoguttaceae bacterium]